MRAGGHVDEAVVGVPAAPHALAPRLPGKHRVSRVFGFLCQHTWTGAQSADKEHLQECSPHQSLSGFAHVPLIVKEFPMLEV